MEKLLENIAVFQIATELFKVTLGAGLCFGALNCVALCLSPLPLDGELSFTNLYHTRNKPLCSWIFSRYEAFHYGSNCFTETG